MRRGVLTFLFIVAGCSSNGPLSPDDFHVDRFDSGALARYAKYTDGGDPWSVAGGVLRGSGLSMQSVLILKGESIQNGWIETAVDSADDGGLVLRFSDNDNYFLLAIRDDASGGSGFYGHGFPDRNLEIYERRGSGQDGFVSVWQYNFDWPRGQLMNIRFETVGDSLKVRVNEELVGAIRVEPLPGSGFGLRHQGTEMAWISRYHWLRWKKNQPGAAAIQSLRTGPATPFHGIVYSAQ